MLNIPRWKIILTLIVCAFGVLYTMPNLIGQNARDYIANNLPGFVPHQAVNLGLDLQGGSHLLLEVDLDDVLKERADGLVTTLRPELRSGKIGYRRLSDVQSGGEYGARITLREEGDADAVRQIIRDVDNLLEVDVEGNQVSAIFSEEAIIEIQKQTD